MAFALLALLLGLAFAFGIGGDSDPEPEVIEGTEGDDSLVGGDRDELIHGLGGDDTIRDGGGDDTVEGGDDDDLVFSNLGDDWLEGGAGNDTLISWNGRDSLFGGDGDDLLSLGSDDGGLAEGGAGNDRIGWSGGEATVRGGVGDDTISIGGELRDGLVEGGVGTDLLSVGGVYDTHHDIVFSDDGAGTLTDGSAVVDFTGIEELSVGYAIYRVDASASDAGVIVTGRADHDYYGGSSTIIGGGGDDRLTDGTVMDGGDGDDILVRTDGGGTLTGGDGDDLFVVEHDRWVDGNGMFQASATTRVTDFTPGEDRISLTVTYVAEYGLGGDTYTMDPPVVTIVEDLEANETRILVNGGAAMVLYGATGIDPADIEIEIVAR